MMDLFKIKPVIEEAPIVATEGKTINQLIEEIHEDFYTEVDKLLIEAKIKKPLDSDKQDLIDKSERLKKLGFNNTKEVVESSSEVSRIQYLEKENKNKESLVETITYFSNKYPLYKFITEESVKKICNKYGLVYGEVSNYIGDVPDKNLKQIENFKIDESDEIVEEIYMGNFISGMLSTGDFMSYTDSLNKRLNSPYLHKKLPLEIAAPVKDFNMLNMEVKDFKVSKIEIPDPVVLKPVFHNGSKHYLIVTAWGEEASDELVVNQKFN